jgi:hypothetical protein
LAGCSDGAPAGRTAYVTFKDPKALEIALLLSVCPFSRIELFRLWAEFPSAVWFWWVFNWYSEWLLLRATALNSDI